MDVYHTIRICQLITGTKNCNKITSTKICEKITDLKNTVIITKKTKIIISMYILCTNMTSGLSLKFFFLIDYDGSTY